MSVDRRLRQQRRPAAHEAGLLVASRFIGLDQLIDTTIAKARFANGPDDQTALRVVDRHVEVNSEGMRRLIDVTGVAGQPM